MYQLEIISYKKKCSFDINCIKILICMWKIAMIFQKKKNIIEEQKLSSYIVFFIRKTSNRRLYCAVIRGSFKWNNIISLIFYHLNDRTQLVVSNHSSIYIQYQMHEMLCILKSVHMQFQFHLIGIIHAINLSNVQFSTDHRSVGG